MNKMNTPTANDIWQGILEDLYYPSIDQQRGTVLYVQSSDMGYGQLVLPYLRALDLEERFVALVAKSDQLAFELEKAISGTTCKTVTPLAQAFYQLNEALSQLPLDYRAGLAPPRHEISESCKLLQSVFLRLGVANARFTGNPLHLIGADHLLEADFLNGVIARIREGTRRKDFKARIDRRAKEASKAMSRANKLVARLAENQPYLYGLWFDLAYRTEEAKSISLSASAGHLRKFFDRFKDEAANSHAAGFVWVRQYLTEVGYRTRLLLLFDAAAAPQGEASGTVINDLWEWATCGKGYAVASGNRCEAGLILWRLRQIFMRNVHLRLEPSPDYDHFGLSDMPPQNASAPTTLASASPTLSFSEMVLQNSRHPSAGQCSAFPTHWGI